MTRVHEEDSVNCVFKSASLKKQKDGKLIKANQKTTSCGHFAKENEFLSTFCVNHHAN